MVVLFPVHPECTNSPVQLGCTNGASMPGCAKEAVPITMAALVAASLARGPKTKGAWNASSHVSIIGEENTNVKSLIAASRRNQWVGNRGNPELAQGSAIRF